MGPVVLSTGLVAAGVCLFVWITTGALVISNIEHRPSIQIEYKSSPKVGYKSSQVEERCDDPSIWDAEVITHQNKLLVKRHITSIIDDGAWKDFRDFEIPESPEVAINASSHRVKRATLPLFVYRVLRPDEDFYQGIRAKKPEKKYKPTYHVCFGSTYQTQYISTTAERSVAMDYIKKTSNNGVVKINVKIAEEAGLEILDLRDGQNVRGKIAQNFARASAEILMSGETIPFDAIEKHYIYDKSTSKKHVDYVKPTLQ